MKTMKPKTVILCLLLMGCAPSAEYKLALQLEEAIAEHDARYADVVNRYYDSLSPEEKARRAANCRQNHPGGVMTGFRLGEIIPPEYPLIDYLLRREGKAIVHVTFLQNGSLDQVTVERSSGHESLDQAAIDAVKKWSFRPAKEGPPICNGINIPINFRLTF